MKIPAKTREIILKASELYHKRELLSSDPLEFVYQYSDPWDQEVVAIGAALLAYGNVKQIRASIRKWLESFAGQSPQSWVRSLGTEEGIAQALSGLKGWKHRFNKAQDLVTLFRLVERSWREYGTLGAHFTSRLEPSHTHIGSALESLMAEWGSWAREMGQKKSSSFHFFLTSPANGGCCKRWCMFLLWLGRKDELDPGLWTVLTPEPRGKYRATFKGRFVRPDQLIIPLDVHLGRISQSMALTRRKTTTWKTALEVTESLKQIDPQDPVRFDFALSRLGIVKGWKGGSLDWLLQEKPQS